MTTHGQAILARLRQLMKDLGRKPSDLESAHEIDTYLTAQAVKLRRPRKPSMPTARACDAVFDVLAKIDGQTGPITRHAGARLAAAKKQIIEVMPEATADQMVAEIESRWARFCRKFTDPRNRTAMALVGHWGEFGDPDQTDERRTRAAASNIYAEPAGNWRVVMAVLMNLDVAVLADKQWADLSPDYRSAVLRDMAKNKCE